MRRFFLLIPFFIFLGLLPQQVFAQQASVYNPYDVFDAHFFSQDGNNLRAADGAPGSDYWQNKADYEIHTILEVADTLVKGKVNIHYTNNSPHDLQYLWLQLDQNLFDKNSRGAATTPTSGDRFDVRGVQNGGYQIQSVSVQYKGDNYDIEPVINDTRMQIRLPFKMKGNGTKIRINVAYDFHIPRYGADRMGRQKTEKGIIYQIAQWYPRMCVYDDIVGWNTVPYTGLGEFYLEYGDFDYYVTVPADMIVAGSGVLQNPKEVLTRKERKRLEKAKNSDESIFVISPEEVGARSTRPKHSGTLTWHFTMENTRDISWAASTSFIWDAAKINFPSGRNGLAMSVYPAESKGQAAYGRATQYLKKSIEFYSENYFEYPWTKATVVAGVALGMEYPGIVFCSYKNKGKGLWMDVTHEIGHNWFPMIVGSNERMHMWQDEGLNTFINEFASDWFNEGEYAGGFTNNLPLRMGKMMPRFKESLSVPTYSMGLKDYNQYYFKTKLALDILRNDVLGADRFDYAFKIYINRWAFKHPQPIDFFRTMNDATGEKLDWYWKEWFYTTWTLDQAVKEVKYKDENSSKVALITIENLGKMALPVMMKIKLANGKTTFKKLPVDIWQRGGEWTFEFDSDSKIESITIDPQKDYPDTDRSNNVWVAE